MGRTPWTARNLQSRRLDCNQTQSDAIRRNQTLGTKPAIKAPRLQSDAIRRNQTQSDAIKRSGRNLQSRRRRRKRNRSSTCGERRGRCSEHLHAAGESPWVGSRGSPRTCGERRGRRSEHLHAAGESPWVGSRGSPRTRRPWRRAFSRRPRRRRAQRCSERLLCPGRTHNRRRTSIPRRYIRPSGRSS